MPIDKPQETICYKVNQMIQHIEQAVKTRNISVEEMAKALHDIRLKAQTMEDAIKLRKETMASVPGLEAKYQKRKGKRNTPDGGNKIRGVDRKNVPEEDLNLTVIILQNGKEVYNVPSRGGVFATVEKFGGVDDVGCIEGKTQTLTWGHPLAVWFAFDQLKQATEARRATIGADLDSVIRKGLLRDPDQKSRLLEILNKLTQVTP